MKFFTALIALTAFAAAQGGEQGAQADMMVTAQQANSNGNQSQMKEYPLPPNQGGNNSSGNQGQQPYPTPIPNQQPGGSNQPSMEEFQKFMQSPLMMKFMEYLKSKKETNQY